MANSEQRAYTEGSIQRNDGKSQKTSLRQQARGADHQPDRPGRHLRGDRHLVEPGSPVAHQQLAKLLTRQLRRKGEISSPAWTFQPARCTKAQAESGDRSGGNPAPDAPLARKGSSGSCPSPRSHSACSEFGTQPWLKARTSPGVERLHGPDAGHAP